MQRTKESEKLTEPLPQGGVSGPAGRRAKEEAFAAVNVGDMVSVFGTTLKFHSGNLKVLEKMPETLQIVCAIPDGRVAEFSFIDGRWYQMFMRRRR